METGCSGDNVVGAAHLAAVAAQVHRDSALMRVNTLGPLLTSKALPPLLQAGAGPPLPPMEVATASAGDPGCVAGPRTSPGRGPAPFPSTLPPTALPAVAADGSAAAHPGRSVVVFIRSVGGSSAAVFPECTPADLMSNAALTVLSKHLAAARAHTGVDVGCVAPGVTEAAMFAASTLGPMGAAAR
eukprot:contig_13816_g3326